MKLYLASRFSRRDELREHAKQLRAAGHVVDVTWLSDAHDFAIDGDPSLGEKFALDDMNDLMAADCVMSFTEDPNGNVPGRSRGGRHVEFGIGLAAQKLMIVVGPRENVFHYLPGVLVHKDLDEAIRQLKYFHVGGDA